MREVSLQNAELSKRMSLREMGTVLVLLVVVGSASVLLARLVAKSFLS
jgi:hypothetical protein